MATGTTLDHVGRYKVVGEVGKGAMGVVYKATDPTIGRTVALKTMRVDVHGLEAEEMLQRFRNEAKAAGVMNHPNIVTIYDAGEQEGLFYIAMECIEGVTLHRLLAEKRVIPVEQMVEYAGQVCAGLDYAHAHGVVHRDVKPANIMIQSTGALKIMDFGIAKSGGAGMTTAGQVLGTPNYMSPEQVKGRPLDGRSDLFSLGVILYEMVTGEKPFTGQTVTTIVYKIVHESPIPPRELDVTIHPGLSWIITKALSKAPDERFQTGAELAGALENYKAYGPTGEITTSITTRASAPAASGKTAPVAARPAKAMQDEVTPLPSAYKWPAQLTMAFSALRRRPFHVAGALAALVLLLAGFAWYRNRPAMSTNELERELSQPINIPPSAAQSPSPQTAGGQPATAEPAASQPADTPGAGTAPATQPAAATPPKATPTTKKTRNITTSSTPAQSVAPGSGEMRLTSYPTGAQVQIDGWTEPKWITPFRSPSMSAGKHTVIFSKSGYITQTQEVEVAAGQSLTVHAQLPTAVPTLSVSSDPAGASILVDGKDTGRLTPAKITVERGDHKIVVRKTGFADANVSTTIAEGETFEFAPKLQPGSSEGAMGKLKSFFGGIPSGKGQLDVKSDPKGAQIDINGRTFEKKAPAKIILDPGSYTIALKMEGYKPLQKTVKVEEGKKFQLDEKLEKQ